MDSIRVNTGDKRIEVNDQGEFIILRFSDQSFPNRVFAMIDRVQAVADNAKAEEAALKEQCGGDTDSFTYMKALAEMNEKIHRSIMAEVDEVFGPETCRKVFGDIVPDLTLFEDFFNQMLPFFETFGKERAEKLKKYSASRMGNV